MSLTRKAFSLALLIMVQLVAPMKTVQVINKDARVQIGFVIIIRCAIWFKA